MAPSVEDITTKTDMIEIDPKNSKVMTEDTNKIENDTNEPKSNNDNNSSSEEKVVINAENELPKSGHEDEDKESKNEKTGEVEKNELKNEEVVVVKDEVKKEEKVEVKVEPKTGVSFPVRLDDGKVLNAVGMRKKTILGIGIKIYGFGMFADNEKLKEVMRSKIGKVSAKPTKEMYQAVIDSEAGMMVRLVIVFGNLTMNMVKKNFDEGLGAAIKKLNGGRKNDELSNRVMGEASDDIKLTAGSVIEITRLPGFILQTKVKGEVVSKVESELLCRAFIHMYLGDDPFDRDAKERFGMSLITLF